MLLSLGGATTCKIICLSSFDSQSRLKVGEKQWTWPMCIFGYTVKKFPWTCAMMRTGKLKNEGKIVFSVDYQIKGESEVKGKKTNDYCHQNQRILTLIWTKQKNTAVEMKRKKLRRRRNDSQIIIKANKVFPSSFWYRLNVNCQMGWMETRREMWMNCWDHFCRLWRSSYPCQRRGWNSRGKLTFIIISLHTASPISKMTWMLSR